MFIIAGPASNIGQYPVSVAPTSNSVSFQVRDSADIASGTIATPINQCTSVASIAGRHFNIGMLDTAWRIKEFVEVTMSNLIH